MKVYINTLSSIQLTVPLTPFHILLLLYFLHLFYRWLLKDWVVSVKLIVNETTPLVTPTFPWTSFSQLSPTEMREQYRPSRNEGNSFIHVSWKPFLRLPMQNKSSSSWHWEKQATFLELWLKSNVGILLICVNFPLHLLSYVPMFVKYFHM